MRDQLRRDLLYFFGNQSILHRAATDTAIRLVMKGHRPQFPQYIARCAHVLNIVLHIARRTQRAQLAVAIDHHGNRVCYSCGDTSNTGDQNLSLSGTDSYDSRIGRESSVAYENVVATVGGTAP